jgi:hypothetical protein
MMVVSAWRHLAYYREGQPCVNGVEWLVIPDESTGLTMHRTGQVESAPCKDLWSQHHRDDCGSRVTGFGLDQP